MQIEPTKITNFNRTDAELQAFWIFGCVVAGKNSDYAARVMSRLLSKCNTTPFEYLRELGEIGIRNALVASKSGNYTRITRFIMESMDLDLRTATLDQLLAVHGIGNKTARFFLLHTRPNIEVAVLDVHILKYMKEKGCTLAPTQTPTSSKLYAELEKAFLYHAKLDFPCMSIADIDLLLWMRYSGRLENDTSEPQSLVY
jgi:thermostable 8-oxoguanine DNA glycosylase